MSEDDSSCWYDEQVSFMPDLESPKRVIQNNMAYRHPYLCKQELELQYHMPHESFIQLPHLESPKFPHSAASASCNNLVAAYGIDVNQGSNTIQSSTLTQEEQIEPNHQQNMNSFYNNNSEQAVDQVTDWRVLDKFVASQLSHEELSKEPTYCNSANVFHVPDHMNNILNRESSKQEIASEYASTPTSSCQIDLWK
ncbi:hypothetical protein IFM89_018726 [Coptis chinensis]|uniref:Uncharacterized protein n=1 Tax=Coptis chinensis TaxID=261450 RepID=A0A835ICR6_9MAGN|nr:hypothetical protein IFM89_018726 [Coptis chinensis]